MERAGPPPASGQSGQSGKLPSPHR
ncbi:hypothetical protein C265_25583 [Cupriavidus sp. GA3-3]|nr:hypothetical protein C265_25583 [Cupriavidus sp. GA3-3]